MLVSPFGHSAGFLDLGDWAVWHVNLSLGKTSESEEGEGDQGCFHEVWEVELLKSESWTCVVKTPRS